MRKKVHPSPPPPPHRDAVSVLKILPVAIATLSAALLPKEQEVLAYLIACSCSCPSSVPMHHKTTKPKTKTNRKSSSAATQVATMHTPVFECRCFACYMTFWSRWDSSPNRDLIHKAIDLFDDHMAATDANADSTVSSSHRQKQPQRCPRVPSANNAHKNSEGVKVKVEEGESKCPPVSRASTFDNHPHRNGTAGRGLMRRIFPNIMGFVAQHLWTVWSPPV